MLYVNDFLVNNLLGYKEILYHMVPCDRGLQ